MAIAMWQRGRRLFTTAACMMILMAAVHTAGNMAARPDNDAERRVFAEMSGYHVPLGMGMTPSVQDIYWTLAMTMSITFTALGGICLVLSSSRDVSDRVLQRVGWVNAVWVGAFLILSWMYRIPPPLISAVLIEVFVVAALVAGGRSERRA
jgi:hypothetical protein